MSQLKKKAKTTKPQQQKKTLVLTGNRDTAHWDTSANCEKLETLQKHVGGYVEGAAMDDGWECYVNEEGLVKQLPQNESCAYLLNYLLGDYFGLICGPAVFVFQGQGKTQAMQKADRWFQKYKNDNDFDGIIESD